MKISMYSNTNSKKNNMAIISINGKIGSGKDTIAEIVQYLTDIGVCSDPDVKLSEDSFATYKSFEDWRNRILNFDVYTPIWKRRKFADKLKDIVCLLIGCTREQLEDPDFKNKGLGEEWVRYLILDKGYNDELIDIQSSLELAEYHWGADTQSYEINEEELTPRKILQLLGTEAGRNIIHPNIWVNALFSDYGNSKAQHWIITDMRFPNEKKAVEDRSGITIKIERKTELRYSKLWREFQKQTDFDQWDDFLRAKGLFDSVYHSSETALDNDENWDYIIENNGSMEELVEKVRNVLKSMDDKVAK